MSVDPEKIAGWRAAREACDADEGLGSDVLMTDSDLVFFRIAREALPTLVSEVESLRALLREVEFAGDSAVDECPICRGEWDGLIHSGHAPDCRLAAALKGAP